MNARDYAALAAIMIMVLAGAYASPSLPETIAVHWNAEGNADGYAPKAAGLVILPLITLAIYGLLLLIPKIEIFKENMNAFKGYYDNIKLLLVLFMLALHLATLAQNLGRPFNMNQAVLPALGVLIYYLGHVMRYMKRSFFVGIRTPWTLASDAVWDRTHRIGSVTFRINAGILVISSIAPSWGVWLAFGSLIANAVFLAAYSYWVYRKEGKNQLA
ncbi:MAG: DUF1648 domain-containing protein [Candidatus Altiarchaeota archaeon]|nr:DUF1648 domain-containing protein [Candidatus Altiarchaeota archaeon]